MSLVRVKMTRHFYRQLARHEPARYDEGRFYLVPLELAVDMAKQNTIEIDNASDEDRPVLESEIAAAVLIETTNRELAEEAEAEHLHKVASVNMLEVADRKKRERGDNSTTPKKPKKRRPGFRDPDAPPPVEAPPTDPIAPLETDDETE